MLRFGRVFTQPRLARFKHTDMAKPVNKTAHPFDKARLEALLNRRFFYAPAFEIYGGPRLASLSILLADTSQASQGCTTMARRDRLSKPTSSPNGAVTLSCTITCSSSIRRS